MKKNGLMFPVLLLICAGMVMIGCPSDPEPGTTIVIPPPGGDEEGNELIVLKGGKYLYLFDTPKIEAGKEYELIFTIDQCDSALYTSNLGGKICYRMDMDDEEEGDNVLSGWANSTPTAVSEGIKEYKWVFKGGEKNKDSQPIANGGTTPDGATQYFSLMAQTSGWKDPDPDFDFNVVGKFEVKSKDVIEYETTGTSLTLGNMDGITGKGNLTDDDMILIRGAPTKSKIVFTYTVATVYAAGTDEQGKPEPGFGVVGVGNPSQTNSVSLSIPSTASAGSNQTFTGEFEVGDLLKLLSAGEPLFINPYNGTTVSKAELFKPKS
jgi:hypothetical protein